MERTNNSEWSKLVEIVTTFVASAAVAISLVVAAAVLMHRPELSFGNPTVTGVETVLIVGGAWGLIFFGLVDTVEKIKGLNLPKWRIALVSAPLLLVAVHVILALTFVAVREAIGAIQS